MRTAAGVVIAAMAMVLAFPVAAAAEPMIRPATMVSAAPATGAVPRQECWIEHVQVQPARIGGGAFLADPGVRAARGEHLGSEHWNAAMRKACKLQSMAGMRAGTYDGHPRTGGN